MKASVIAITSEGRKTAELISAGLENCSHDKSNEKVAEKIRRHWNESEAIICIMATGIVVRAIAPLVRDKRTDPCVIVLDQKGKFVISLLSGHLGGGNELTEKLSRITGGMPVITTASDVLGKTPLDLWARRNDLVIEDYQKLTKITANFIDGHRVKIFRNSEKTILPGDLEFTSIPEEADLVITYNKNMTFGGLCCIPRSLFLGVGCNRGTDVADIRKSFEELCRTNDIAPQAFRGICSIDVKNDEAGILLFAKEQGFTPKFYSRDELNTVKGVSFSSAVMKAVGAKGVAEPAAILGAAEHGDDTDLIVRKMKWKDVTLAVAERKKDIWD
jgi:cobalt-precorrin 5A hydrolase